MMVCLLPSSPLTYTVHVATLAKIDYMIKFSGAFKGHLSNNMSSTSIVCTSLPFSIVFHFMYI